jgi:type IV secretion system protein VirB5
MKRIVYALLSIAGLAAVQSAFAGIPVIDASNLAQQVQQVIAWGKQFEQMEQQFNQLQQQYNSLNGVRGMASLVNNPALRNYLPEEFQDLLSGNNLPAGISGSISAIRDAAQLLNVNDTGLSVTSDAAHAFIGAQNQNALNRAVGEEGYRQASQRFDAIQQLLDKVNAAPEQKDILDLQARIQAEEVMVQNEQVKLKTITYLAQAQRDIQQQQAREMSMKAAAPLLPTGW